MSSSSELTGFTEPPSTIEEIIERISKLHDSLPSVYKSEGYSFQQTTDATIVAADKQDGSESGDVSQQNDNEIDKQEGDVSQQENNDESKKQSWSNYEVRKKKSLEREARTRVQDELGKLRQELGNIISSFKDLKNFLANLREPLQTLDEDIFDILKDLTYVTVTDLPKQFFLNLRLLKINLGKLKTWIWLVHQTAKKKFELDRPMKETVPTREADGLPHLYGEEIFEISYYFKEIQEKYNELDDRQKLCLLCFVIFPENAEIKKRLLRFWWVGENLLPVKEEKEEMELVSQTIQTFVEKGLIEPVQKKNKLQPRSYKMNPIVRSCLIKFAKEAAFFDYDSEGKPTMDFSSCKKACMVKSGALAGWFSAYLRDPRLVRLSTDLVKLQMLFNFPTPQTLVEASQRLHELQTLFNISIPFPALPLEWFSKMTSIKVLYLGKWETKQGRNIVLDDIHFLEGLKNMKKLRLLSLQGISGILWLPNSVCELSNLRILDLRECHNLTKLPYRIGSLKKLTYLDISGCYRLNDMPKHLNQLCKLQVLKGFMIGDDRNSCTLEDLAGLKNLRKLSVYVNTRNFNVEDKEKALSKFQKLQKLKIAWGSRDLTGTNFTQNSSGQQSDSSNPNRGERMKQEKNAVKPKNAEGLESLVKLDLRWFPHTEPPTWLTSGKLNSLQNLSVRGGRLRHLNQEGKEEWKVETLRLKFLRDFKMNWKEMLKQFPNLKYLEKVRCPRITFCPCDARGVWQKSTKSN